MGAIVYAPQYKAYLIQPAPPQTPPQGALGRFSGLYGQPAISTSGYAPMVTWSLTTLKAAQLNLSTTGVGTATVSFYDPNRFLRQQVQPRAMNVLALFTTNRFGAWGPCWLGYVDAAHTIMDPTQGETMEMQCTSPYKLFEVTRQSPGDVQTLALAYLQNVAGTSVLAYAAQACRYPSSLLTSPYVDPAADTGSGIWTSIPQGAFTDPDQQTWSAVLQALLANSGLEMFTDESGILHWRPLGYLGPQSPALAQTVPLPPRPVLDEELLHADFAETDQNVVTNIEVRWGINPLTQSAARWAAPSGMAQGLGTRLLTVHAPWLQSKSAADYLAQALGQMYAANVLVGSVIIPADPTFGVGTVAEIPSLRSDQGNGYYYITAVSYNLEWGGPWTMTLGLAYGRAPNQTFPYIGIISKPILTAQAQQAFPSQASVALSPNPNNPAQLSNAFTVSALPALANNGILLDPTLGVPAGTVVYLRAADGTTIGPTPNGEYTVQAGVSGSGFVAYVKGTTGLPSTGVGYITIRQLAAAATTATSGQSSTSTVSSPAVTGNPGTGFYSFGGQSPVTPVTSTTVVSGNTLAVRALRKAQTLAGQPYGLGQAGPTSWDCSGLVDWAYTQIGFSPSWWLPAPGPHFGPSLIYYRFLQYTAAKAISVDQAQPGDLLFIQEQRTVHAYPDSQQGFSHVAFCSQAGGFASGRNFGADSTQLGITDLPISGFRSFFGTGFNLALDMSGVR